MSEVKDPRCNCELVSEEFCPVHPDEDFSCVKRHMMVLGWEGFSVEVDVEGVRFVANDDCILEDGDEISLFRLVQMGLKEHRRMKEENS